MSKKTEVVYKNEYEKVQGGDFSTEAEKEKHKGNRYLQYAACVSVSLLAMTLGTIYSWTSPAMPHLRSNASEILLTETEIIWIATLPDIGAFFGNMAMLITLNHLGRKYWILFLGAPQALLWLMILFAKDSLMLYVPRFISGLIGDIGFLLIPLYVGEIADKEIRGILLLGVKIFSNFGHMYVKAIGAFFSYNILNIMMSFVPFTFFITFIFMPESPYYLVLKNRKSEALKTLMKLKGVKKAEDVISELERIQEAVEESRESKRWKFRELFFIKGNRKSLIIVLIAWLTKFLCGSYAINSFTQEILEETGMSFSPKVCAMILAMIEVKMTIISTSIIERTGRRWTFLLSGLFCSLGLLIVGLFFFFKIYLKADVHSFFWLPLFGLVIFQIAISLGISYIPIIMLGEMFSLDVKLPAMFTLSISLSLLTVLIKFAFQKLNTVIGIYTTFWIFGIFCIVGSITFFVITPETKGKTLEEIQKCLHRRKSQVDKEAMTLEMTLN